MSERDLVQELKANIKDLQSEKADMAKTIESKESRIKQLLIKLEHATSDVQSVGNKIGQQNKHITELEAKLEAKEELLDEALDKLKANKPTDDTNAKDQELDQ
mgnify:CR=1 FL=1|tara:strand:+ start:1787 stop:2095 length:309 start_codon:yes stop_codon:yes gene_type:complete